MQGHEEIPEEVLAFRKLEKELERETGGNDKDRTFRIFIRDADTGRQVRFMFPGLFGPWFFLKLIGVDRISGFQSWPNYKLELKLLRSSLFCGLQKKQLAAAQWLSCRAITLECERREPHRVFTLSARELRRLHGMRRQCARIERELAMMTKPVREMMSHTVSDEIEMHEELDRAISDLRRFRQRAGRVRSQTYFLEFRKKDMGRYWMLRLPAVAYALFRLLSEYSEPRILKREAYRRIGTFEQEFLGCKSRSAEADTEDTVRRQVYTFKSSANRKHMDRILQRLLASRWHCLDSPLNCDWENPKTLPHPSR
jgi:hypothetical protein